MLAQHIPRIIFPARTGIHKAHHLLFTCRQPRRSRSKSNMAIRPTSPVFEPAQVAHGPNTCQSVVRTRRGDFLVQVAWPLHWNQDRTLPEGEAARQDISIM